MRAKLAREARALRRKIFASLPPGVRLAYVWSRVAFNTKDSFGRIALALMLASNIPVEDEMLSKAGVTPASLGITSVRDYKKLPERAGSWIAKMAYLIVVKKIPRWMQGDSDDIVDQEATDVMMKMLDGKVQFLPGSSFKQAFNFITKILENEVLDRVRSEGRRKKYETQADDDITFHSTEDVMDAIKQIPPAEQHSLLKDLLKIPSTNRGKQVLELLLQGYKGSEIADEMGISYPAVTKALGEIRGPLKDKILRTFSQYLTS